MRRRSTKPTREPLRSSAVNINIPPSPSSGSSLISSAGQPLSQKMAEDETKQIELREPLVREEGAGAGDDEGAEVAGGVGFWTKRTKLIVGIVVGILLSAAIVIGALAATDNLGLSSSSSFSDGSGKANPNEEKQGGGGGGNKVGPGGAVGGGVSPSVSPVSPSPSPPSPSPISPTSGGGGISPSVSPTSSGPTAGPTSSLSPSSSPPPSPPIVRKAPYLVAYWATWLSSSLDLPDVPSYVDMILVSFAVVGSDGTIPLSLMGYSDAQLAAGIKAAHGKGQIVLLSVGGAGNCGPSLVGDNMFGTSGTASAFAASVTAMVNKFNFDGVDIDYECYISASNRVQNTANALAAVQALRQAMPQPKLLTWAAFSSVWSAGGWVDFTTTFRAVAPYLDLAFWMTYNVESDPSAAANWYAQALGRLSAVAEPLGGAVSKVTMGYCAGKGCDYGPGPSDDVVLSWARAIKSQNGGGMMLWDINDDAIASGANFPGNSLSKAVADIFHA